MKIFRYKTACKQVLGDLHTPVSIYLKVRDIYPQSALLESSDFHAGENSLSYIALCPLASFDVNGDVCTMSFPDRTVFREPVGESFSVTDALNAFLKKFRIEGRTGRTLRPVRIHGIRRRQILREDPGDRKPRRAERCAGHNVYPL